MKRLGAVLHMTRNGYIVARLEQDEAEKLPPLNVPVYDRDLNKVGILLDIIGPVKNPYVVVKPINKEIKVYEGEILYYKIPRPRKKKLVRTKKRQRQQGSREAGNMRRRGRGGSASRRGRARRERRGQRGARR